MLGGPMAWARSLETVRYVGILTVLAAGVLVALETGPGRVGKPHPLAKVVKQAPRPYTPQSYGLPLTYYSVRGALRTQLTINNKGLRTMKPVVTLYNRSGQGYRIDNIVVGPARSPR
jgi:hypothetical protein